MRAADTGPARAAHHAFVPGRTFRSAAPPRGPERTVEYDLSITLNRFGFHGPDHAPLREPGKGRIALVGDSMVEAFQVSREEGLGARLEAGLPGTEVLAFGKSGHSTIKQDRILAELPLLLREGERTDLPDAVVFAVHGPYAVRQTLVDFVRPAALWRRGLSWALLHYTGPSRLLLEVRDSVLVRLEVPTEDLLEEAARAFRPGRTSDLGERAWALLGKALGEQVRWCRERGVRPIYAYIPDLSEIPAPDARRDTDAIARRFEGMAKAAGADWIDLTAGMRRAAAGGEPLFLKYDQHLTARGHAVAGALLAERLRPLLEGK
ncbi:MAG: hypothetical protein L6R43_16465 [Planctomycetes bacterium]|nr:hypothetical protein [Planctomycetota bacterium]